ncbi:GNAT family N-acetyltransferase [Saccharothrix coeruleofusca]|uniref:N-acetyltransferase domain-containing protein n=1 Tax=Saccharothrix coeruleofusca TaxID=33919 RepID=A0A918ANK4_9PSEU|nr:GNAT family N-acetyltransferase [Saccharothrix coeruleofusca]MBP2339607.1 RimJ/RimL family protein N-acetyltransferase [Saccharothrix coeruleofusca]GGP56525.1 hypothetical protein GCM10010185_30890 [Saccharothrix coeruleofusca]
MTAKIELLPWSEGDVDLLRLLNAPELTAQLGGPETAEQVLARHRRYLALTGGRMYRVSVGGEQAGCVGYWPRSRHDAEVHEVGWSVLPAFQGRGVASAAAEAVVRRAGGRPVHAFPRVDHPASNAVCRKAGFTLLGECDFEYPPGNPIRCNDWVVAG